MLRDMGSRLNEGGRILISVPNFGHWYPRVRTVLGVFDYDQRGILDKTHVRFFTRRSLLRMIKKNGFTVKRMEMTGLPVDVVAGERSLVKRLVLAVDSMLVRLRPTLFAYQFVLEVEPVPPPRSVVWARSRERSGAARAARELPLRWFVGVAVGSAALLMVLSRHVFLFWDDFVFLGEAREGELSWDHLGDPLFRHFSPVVRLVNLARRRRRPGAPLGPPARPVRAARRRRERRHLADGRRSTGVP